MIVFHFIAQTGRISDKPLNGGNFYVYRLPASARDKVTETVERARLGSAGLEYPPLFLSWLAKIDLNK